MPTFTYTALRNIKSGNSVGTDYTITVNLQRATEQINPVNHQHVALSGNTKTVAHRIDQVIDITTDYISTATTPDIDDMLEFLHSVAHGESFTYNDGADKAVILNSAPSRNQAGNIYYTWSFSVRVLA